MSTYRDENPVSGCWSFAIPLAVALAIVVLVIALVLWRAMS